MPKLLRNPLFQSGAAFAGLAIFAAIIIPGPLHSLFSSGYFMPHSHCYLNDPRMIWLQGASDFSIGVAYMLISGTLGYLVYKARKDIPFDWMFLAFGLFIFSCAWTHLMELWTLWHPTYWLSGAIKAITAVASIATAVGLAPLVPRIFSFIETAKASEQRRVDLEKAHKEMAALNDRLRELDHLKSQFFANVSHELRTPLTLILGHADKLRQGSSLTSSQEQSLEVLKHNGQLLLKQVNDLLDAAKLEAGRMELVYKEADLAHLVRLTCSNFETLASARGIGMQVKAPDKLAVEADPEKLEHVLFNLLSNALKFTPDGGKIRCSLRADEASSIIEVEDTGPGIPEDARAIIFERFRQLDGGNNRRFEGTGLGLSIVKDIVKLHGGTVQVGESPEGGARFIVRLPQHAPSGTLIQRGTPPVRPSSLLPEGEPLRDAENARAELTTGSKPQIAQTTKQVGGEPIVLVVEDHPDVNELIRDSLTPEYRTMAAHTGKEGLEKARALHPDLILTDLMMPGMSGDQFIRELRAESALDEVPVIVLTARADDQVRVKVLREGAQDYLLKPFTQEELRARAGNLVSARRSRQELVRAYGEMEAFSYSLAHDLRGPLRAIRSLSGILQEEHSSKLGPEGCAFLDRILKAGRRMDRLIDDVLSYTRMQGNPMDFQQFDLELFLRTLLQERPEFQRPKAEIILCSPFLRVVANETSLTQVTVNLLSNAVKFVNHGATPRVEIWTEPRDGMVRVWFEDNGIGIAPEFHGKLFGLFERLHAEEYEGTGLGLAIVKKAVERMGGTVGLDSQPGKGSRFWFELRAQ